MHKTHVSRQSGSRFVQQKSAAWAIRKPSTNRISPYNRKEISQLLKASEGEKVSKYGMTKSIEDDDKNSDGYNLRRKSSKMLGTIKARLEKNSHVFNAKLKELEPTIRSLTLSQISTKPKGSRTTPHLLKNVVKASKFLEKDQLGIGLLPPPNLEGEKLVTVGGYIISLQETNENITSTIKPRISSDKDGLELEIKVLGCSPTDIKFEKRYDTLIVIGVNKSTLRRFEEDVKNPAVKDGKSKHLDDASRFKMMSLNDLNQEHGFPYGSEHDYLDEIHEIINIFVPKNVSLNQIFISKPDSRGRIFVKGP